MNTLQPKHLNLQDFRTIRTPKSGLMSNILNTLRKKWGREYPKEAKKSGQRK